jgi:hypothetical protein
VEQRLFLRQGAMASCFLGFVVVLLFAVMSLLVLLK